jgi:hypothetical protein
MEKFRRIALVSHTRKHAFEFGQWVGGFGVGLLAMWMEWSEVGVVGCIEAVGWAAGGGGRVVWVRGA